MYPIIDFFGREIGTYGLFAVIGLLLSTTVCFYLGKAVGMLIDDTVVLFLFASMGMLVGGHLLYAVVNIRILFDSTLALNAVQRLILLFGGNVFYGGMLGAALSLLIFKKLSKKKFAKYSLDLFAVSAPLFHAFGRIGCFFGGCCYGVPSDIGFCAQNNPFIQAVNGVRRFPVVLIESFFNFIIFFVLLSLFKKKKGKRCLFYIYLCLYAPLRFILEFWRGDAERGMLFCLSTSQWISLALAVVLSLSKLCGHIHRKLTFGRAL